MTKPNNETSKLTAKELDLVSGGSFYLPANFWVNFLIGKPGSK